MQEKLRDFFRITKTKAIISSTLFVVFLISFFLFSSLLLNYCGKSNPNYIDICIQMHSQYDGTDDFVVKTSYFFTVLSMPTILFLAKVGLNNFNPITLWLSALIPNIIYVYILSCLFVFGLSRLFSVKDFEHKKKKRKKRNKKFSKS